ncbi:MAG: hypothetical protein V1816_28635 [Pseudomonadota bacterium]
MIVKLWKVIQAQINKLADFFWQADPIAQMKLEYEHSLEQLKDGRRGLEQYRALVERVTRQVRANDRTVENLTAKVKSYLQVDDRRTAGLVALELQEARAELAENRSQLDLHEKSYDNNLKKIKNASRRLSEVRQKIHKYDAELKMSEAEAEVSKLAQNFNFDLTTDFGELENIIQEKIDLNRAKVRVTADLSGQGLAELEAEERVREALADDLLQKFEVEMGLRPAGEIQAPKQIKAPEAATAAFPDDPREAPASPAKKTV